MSWRWLRRLGMLLLLLVGLAAVALLAGGLWLRGRMRSTLPQLAGSRPLPGLAAPVTVWRDALGVPTVRGADRVDVARATGFLHAQERFFQMDLLRRRAAGELAEILGERLVEVDLANRVHRFRAVARAVCRRLPPAHRVLLAAYAEGVNAGLAALGAPPFEYALLRARPAPWLPEDSILVIESMFLELQEPGIRRESDLGLMHDTLPPALYAFLVPRGTEWDAPLVGGLLPEPPLPGPEVVDLRRRPVKAALRVPGSVEAREAARPPLLGSNAWAVAGSRTADGHALLANDMHLELRVPNIWYRVSLAWKEAGGAGERRVTGVTLPGAPLVAVGSNGHVAWGFTNSFGDWMDLILLETDPARPGAYRTPEGFRPFARSAEVIRVHGGRPRRLDVQSTIWGPVVGKDHRGRLRALAWTAQHEDAVDLGLLGLESAGDVEAALAAGSASGVPAQNLLVADAAGRIGWTIAGRIPRRVGFDGELPTSWADGSRRWAGWLAPGEAPRVVDPPSGRLWSANNRMLDGDRQRLLGDSGYDLGARARQIRDDLARLEKATPRDLLAIQLDDRALFLERWRDLLLRALSADALAGHPRRAELRRLVATGWSGRAAIDSTAFRLVRSFRLTTFNLVLQTLTAPSRAADPSFGYDLEQAEGPLWRAVSLRPPHLLAAEFHSWDELFQAAVDSVIRRFSPKGEPLSETTWGQANYVILRHPLSPALPGFSFPIDMPPHSLPGSELTPRFQDQEYGASERLVVSPGQEAQGIFEMPAGQSGNPLSPHYGDSYPAWVKGEPAPFLPGPTIDRLTLTPSPRTAGRVP